LALFFQTAPIQLVSDLGIRASNFRPKAGILALFCIKRVNLSNKYSHRAHREHRENIKKSIILDADLPGVAPQSVDGLRRLARIKEIKSKNLFKSELICVCNIIRHSLLISHSIC
jgi:hypothetical protein